LDLFIYIYELLLMFVPPFIRGRTILEMMIDASLKIREVRG